MSTSNLPEGLTRRRSTRWSATRVAAGEDLYRLDEGALAELDADVVLTQDLCAVCAVDLDRVDDALAYLGCTARGRDPRSAVARRCPDLDPRRRRRPRRLRARHEPSSTSLRTRPRRARTGPRRPTARSVLVLEWTDPPFCAGHWVPDLVTARWWHRGARASPVVTPAGSPGTAVRSAPRRGRAGGAVRLPRRAGRRVRRAARRRRPASRAAPRCGRSTPTVTSSGPVRASSTGAETVAQILHPAVVGVPAPDRALRVDRVV